MRPSRSHLVALVLVVGCNNAAPLAPDAPDLTQDVPDSATTDGGAPMGKVGMFVAQGTLGRTIISCDDGLTWVGNHSWNVDGDALMCGQVQSDVRCGSSTCCYEIGGQDVDMPCCNDTPDIPEGVAFSDRAMVGAWGHGKPGALRTSVDGVNWTTTAPSPALSVAYGGGRFVAAGNRRTFYSDPDGVTWTQGGDAAFNTMGSPVRAIGYGAYGTGGRFIAVSAGSGRDILVTSDGGLNWWRPTTIPATCVTGGIGNAGGEILGAPDDVLVMVDAAGTDCYSQDGGVTWNVAATGLTTGVSHAVWTGSEILFWGQTPSAAGNAADAIARSTDGIHWTTTMLSTPTRLGPIARSDTGAFVAIPYLYDSYERQHMLRSTDGVTWEQLPDTAFPQGHSIFRISYGYGDPSDVCPLSSSRGI